MLTFTEAAADLSDSKRLQEAQKRAAEEYQPLLDNFFTQFSRLPYCVKILSPNSQSSLKNDLNTMIAKKIESLLKSSAATHEPPFNSSAEETDPRCFVSGKYDALIFSEHPKVTAEFQAIINKYNEEFIQTLFFKCKSKNQIQFWLTHSPAKLPGDSIPLAISLGCNIYVLQYLKEQGWFKKGLSRNDKLELLAKAKRFQSAPGYNYLLEECDFRVSPAQRSQGHVWTQPVCKG